MTSWLPSSAAGRCAAACYLVLVGVLAGFAWHDPNGSFGRTELAAIVLTLPAILAAIPVVYVVGAMAWNFTNAGNGGPMWPVTICFVAMFTAMAAANVLLAAWLSRRATTRPDLDDCDVRATG
jgi:hypothetical protein